MPDEREDDFEADELGRSDEEITDTAEDDEMDDVEDIDTEDQE